MSNTVTVPMVSYRHGTDVNVVKLRRNARVWKRNTTNLLKGRFVFDFSAIRLNEYREK